MNQLKRTVALYERLIVCVAFLSCVLFVAYAAIYQPAEKWGNYSEIVLTVITLVLAFYTALLWRSTKQVAEDAKDSSQRQLRAYLNVFECYANWEPERDLLLRKVAFNVQFRNTGQTPAKKVKCWANVTSDSSAPKFEGPAGEPRNHVGVCAPSQIGTIFFMEQFGPSVSDEVAAWERGDKTLYVYGKLIYYDAFDDERTTIFRYVLPTNGVSKKRGRFQHAGEGNDYT